MATTNNLTDTQLVILSHSAQHPGYHVLPLPPRLGNKGGATTRALKSLLKRGLIEETPAGPEDTEWSRSETGERLTLKITDAGLTAIRVGDIEADATASRSRLTEFAAAGAAHVPTYSAEAKAERQSPSLKAFQSGTKAAAIMELLQRKRGASLPDLMQTSGWQAHSVRGFLSGTLKKRHGIEVASEKDHSGVRRYRIAV